MMIPNFNSIYSPVIILPVVEIYDFLKVQARDFQKKMKQFLGNDFSTVLNKA